MIKILLVKWIFQQLIMLLVVNFHSYNKKNFTAFF